MSLAAYPPGFVGPIIEGYRCNEAEWLASTMIVGDRCWWRKKGAEHWTVGTFRWSWFYDGVIAKVYEDDPDDYIEHNLFCGLGDELRATPPD